MRKGSLRLPSYKRSFACAYVLLFVLLLTSCYSNKKLAEGRFVLFSQQTSTESGIAWQGLENLKEFRYSDIFHHHTSSRKGIPSHLIEKQIEARTKLIWITYPFFETQEGRALISRHPHQNFALLSESEIPDEALLPQNVAVIHFNIQEAGYLAGYLAAHFSRRKKIGILSENPSVNQKEMIEGFVAGVYAAEPKATIYREEAPEFTTNDFFRVMAAKMVHQGMDLLFTVTESLDELLLRLAQEKNFYLISGNRMDTTENVWHKNYLAYVTRRIELATFQISNAALDDRFPGGRVIEYGLRQGMVALRRNPDQLINPDLLREIEEIVSRIIMEEIPLLTHMQESVNIKNYAHTGLG